MVQYLTNCFRGQEPCKTKLCELFCNFEIKTFIFKYEIVEVRKNARTIIVLSCVYPNKIIRSVLKLQRLL